MRSFAPQTRSQANRLTSDLQGTAAHGPDPEFLRQVFGGSVDPNVPLGVSPNDAHKAIMVRAITNAAGVLSVPLSFAQMDSLVATSTALNRTYSPGLVREQILLSLADYQSCLCLSLRRLMTGI